VSLDDNQYNVHAVPVIVIMLMKNEISRGDTGLFRKKFSTLRQCLILFWRIQVFWEAYKSRCNLKLSGKLFFLNICLKCYIPENIFS